MKKAFTALLITFTVPTPARAVTFVTGTGHLQFANGATSVSTVTGINVTVGDLIIVFGVFSYAAGNYATSVTDTAGNSYQTAGAGCSTFVTGSDKVEAWYSYATHASAADIVTMKYSQGGFNPSIAVATYQGVSSGVTNETCAVGVTANGTSIVSGTFAPAASGDLSVAYVATNDCNIITAGAGYTARVVAGGLSDSGCVNLEDDVSAPGGAQTASAAVATADQLIMSVLTFRPYVAPGTVKTLYSYDAAGNLTAITNACVLTTQVINPGTLTCCTPQQCTATECGYFQDGCGNTITCGGGCGSPAPPPPNNWTGCPSGYICCEPGATRCAQCYARQCP